MRYSVKNTVFISLFLELTFVGVVLTFRKSVSKYILLMYLNGWDKLNKLCENIQDPVTVLSVRSLYLHVFSVYQ